MTASTRNAICGALFWIKAFFALTIAFGGLGYFSFRVYDARYNALHPPFEEDLVIPPVTDPETKKLNEWQPLPPKPIPINSAQCAASGVLGRLEPPAGKLYHGFHLDWNKDTPGALATRLNKQAPAIINGFFSIGDPAYPAPYQRNILEWFAQETSKIGGILQLSIQPFDVADLPDTTIQALADDCTRINQVYGVPILLRYGHEMNGQWSLYGMKPTLYKSTFIALSTAIKARTNLTAMLWAPNVGTGYPYGYNPALVSLIDFAVLDTNKDGVIDGNDDPYGPYYPGSEHVDWVGLSAYWYSDANQIPVDGYFGQSLTGQGPVIEQVSPRNALRNFYQRFAEEMNKPMAIAETGAPVSSGGNLLDPSIVIEYNIKMRWWSQLWSPDTVTNFPRLKSIVNFEEAKEENRLWKDWRITTNATVLANYLQNIQENGIPSRMLWAHNLTYGCDGQVDVFSQFKNVGKMNYLRDP